MKKRMLSFCLTWFILMASMVVASAVTLKTPTNLSWNGITISWSEVEHAKGYEVRLYCGNRLNKTLTVTEPTLDLTPHMAYGGEYVFRVRALGNGADYTDSAISATSSKQTSRAAARATYTVYVDAQNGDDFGAGTADDPFRSIERARGFIRNFSAQATEDITVYLRGEFYYGENPLYGYTASRTADITNTANKKVDSYEIRSALQFFPSDNPGNGKKLTLKGWGENSVISGGKRVSGWELHDESKNIWKTNVGENERARQARQLYVNGRRAVRARSHTIPEGALFQNQTQYVGEESGIHAWTHPEDAEFVYYRKWCSYRVGVDSVTKNPNGDNYIVNMEPYAWEFAVKAHSSATEVTLTENLQYIENAYELLDVPGEYYIDCRTGDLFYIPRRGEQIETATAVVPMVDELFYAKGNGTADRVKNITLDGITFTDTTWLRPGGAMGHLSNQSDSDRVRGRFYESAVFGTAIENIHMKNCTVKHTGNIGIFYEKEAKNCSFTGNVIRDTAGPGVVLIDPAKEYGGNNDAQKDPDSINENLRFSNNYITNVGLDFPSSTGLVGGRLKNSVFTHNEISECSYSGVSMGWHSGADQVESGNIFAYNIVRDVLTSGIDDGGNFYHLGVTAGNEETPGWLIKENYMTGTYGTVSPMYADNNSSWLVFERNVTSTKYSTNDEKIRAGFTQGGSNGLARNNTFRGNYYTNGGFYDAGDRVWIYTDRKTSGNTYTGNIKCPMDEWPEEALEIIANAGLEPAWKHIKTDRHNLFTDGSFEHTKTAYARPWATSMNATLSRTSSDFTDGAYCGKVTLGSVGSGISQVFRMDLSEKYRFSIRAKATKPNTNLVVNMVYNGENIPVLNQPISTEELTLCTAEIPPMSADSALQLVGFTVSVNGNNFTGDVFYVEACSLYEAEEEIINLTLADGIATANYQNPTEEKNLSVTLAVYTDENRLKHIQHVPMTVPLSGNKTTILVPETETGDTVKLFMWDAETLMPCIAPETETIK